MSKRHGNQTAEETSTASETVQSQPVETAAAVPTGPNYTLNFKRNHPKDRASYGIPGVSGIFVVQRSMFAGAQPFTSNTDLAGLPATLTVDALLVNAKADNKTAKAEAQAAKLAERARKATAKAEATAAKLLEKQAKADAALAAAKAKVEAAAAAQAAKTAEPVGV